MEEFKKDVLEYIEHIKRCVKCHREFSPGMKRDINWYLNDVKKYIEEKKG